MSSWKGRAFIYAKKGKDYILNLPFGISIHFSIVKRVSSKEIDMEMKVQEIYKKLFR